MFHAFCLKPEVKPKLESTSLDKVIPRKLTTLSRKNMHELVSSKPSFRLRNLHESAVVRTQTAKSNTRESSCAKARQVCVFPEPVFHLKYWRLAGGVS